MKKWILRITGGLLALTLATFLILLIPYSSWMSDHRRDLALGSQMLTTTRGDIEYASVGTGVPILRIHGRPGGYDSVVSGPRARPEDYAGYRIIGLSRPGYLRTPLSSGRTPAEQADLYAALLDKLEIRRVIVYGVSGGGPSSVQFALRHPDRTLGLVLVIPLLQSKPEALDEHAPGAIGRFATNFSWWIGSKLMTSSVASKAIRGFDANDDLEVEQMTNAAKSFLPVDLRLVGRENDNRQWANLDIERWPLEKINSPTLIMHGTADVNAPYLGSAKVAKRIPNAKLVTFEDGDHLIIVSRAREIQKITMDFMKQFGTTLDE